jgi:hypothetical protein
MTWEELDESVEPSRHTVETPDAELLRRGRWWSDMLTDRKQVGPVFGSD